MTKLASTGTGHHPDATDFQNITAEALPTLLSRLKAGGYKIVQDEGQDIRSRPCPNMTRRWSKDMKLPVASHASGRQRGADVSQVAGCRQRRGAPSCFRHGRA